MPLWMGLFLYYSTVSVRFIPISNLFPCGVNLLVISVCVCDACVRGHVLYSACMEARWQLLGCSLYLIWFQGSKLGHGLTPKVLYPLKELSHPKPFPCMSLSTCTQIQYKYKRIPALSFTVYTSIDCPGSLCPKSAWMRNLGLKRNVFI